MKLKSLMYAAAACTAFATAADAASIRITEGVRPQVAGTTQVSDPGGAISLGSLGAGDFAEVFGRLGSGLDSFTFLLTGSELVNVSFIFGGLDLASEPDTTESGLIAQDSPESLTFTLIERFGGGVSNVVGTQTFDTDVTSGNPVIFADLDAGNYRMNISSSSSVDRSDYDLRIAAVPLPATMLLLIGGLAGLGAASRRRKS